MNDACILAPALVASDYTTDLLLSMAGFPPATIARERGNALRRWRRAGLVEDFGVRFGPREWRGHGGDIGRDIFTALHGSFVGAPTVQMLALEIGQLDAAGRASRALEHAIEAAVEDGWLLPVRAVVLTEAGRAAVLADPEAVAVVERERAARAAARDLARVTDNDVAAIDAETRGLLALAELTRGRPVPRASAAEDRSRLGLPARTVPRHTGRAHALSGGDPTWPVRARGGR